VIVLGIEGTAHTVGCGILDGKRILSSVSSTYSPPRGGIHPREAAVHHAEKIVPVIQESLGKAGISIEDVDLIAFSMGPGLGPCLRVAATAARALALRHRIPLLGVNHPLGHIEIGRMLSGADDPVMLYVSGGNTQVIAHMQGRYRVFGETVDIGLGNMLDKIARDFGYPFPGGPKIESLAASGHKLLDLPYSVMGMDTSFSGIYTAAKRYRELGETDEDVCFSIQETAFAMLVEVTERALDYLGKSEILLAGGVAKNKRLRDMISRMSEENGCTSYLTDPEYCMDNGAMIARAGQLMYESGQRQSLEQTSVNQNFRIDQVESRWVNSENRPLPMKGAEALIRRSIYIDRKAITKTRIGKGYRDPRLDARIRSSRLRNEASIALRIHEIGIDTPTIYSLRPDSRRIIMQRLDGISLRDAIISGVDGKGMMEDLGALVAKMHSNMISHGDLTTSNMMVDRNGRIYFIDGSMGSYPAEKEALAQDLFLLKESLSSMHGDQPSLWNHFIGAYRDRVVFAGEIVSILRAIEARRRYV
jgi:N6-L-threonylcarbamoyladenine synthase/protein kinase Bud32